MTEVTETIQKDTSVAEPARQEDGALAADANGPRSNPDSHAEHTDKLVPVTEAIRYRKRAQAAEQQLDELNHQLEQLQGELTESRQTVTHLERRQHIDALLADAEAIDIETARLLTEQAVEQMDDPDVRLAVDELVQSKPYLFRQRADESSGAMAARPDHSSQAFPQHVDQTAQRAVSTGDRRDLLDYLRLRRTRQRPFH